MPNHVSQVVTIKGDQNLIKYLHGGITTGSFCQHIKPMPLEAMKSIGNASTTEKPMPDWYTWCTSNWGTKWDVYNVVGIETDLEGTLEEALPLWNKKEDKTLSFYCDTAWSPPVDIWDELVRLGLSVDAAYLDEGMGFWGHYKDGTNNVETETGPLLTLVYDRLGIDPTDTDQ